MPLIETKGAASAQGFGEFAASSAGAVNYIEDVFSTYLFTGTGSDQTIVNNIDLAGKGGLLWYKARNLAASHSFRDSARGTQYSISSNTTSAQVDNGVGSTVFNSNGWTQGLGGFGAFNYVSWTFRKQPKFFDVVTYTGNNSTNVISHSLGSTPACIIVKQTSSSGNDWWVYHKDLPSPKNSRLKLNAIDASYNMGYQIWDTSSTTFTVFGSNGDSNQNGTSYVAYLFAHNAGGFGLTGTDNVISCGSFVTSGTGTPNATITLGYEPQWVMVKKSSGTGNWTQFDNMRGLLAPNGLGSAYGQALYPNDTNAEGNSALVNITPTGFVADTGNTGETWIYIAIRRGPMKVPTSGTSVFGVTLTENASAPYASSAFPVDLGLIGYTSGGGYYIADRLRGAQELVPSSTAAAVAAASCTFDYQNGWLGGAFNANLFYTFKRAPSYFDEVCYTGTGSATTFSHNLGVAPELMIVKNRSSAGYGWLTYSATLGATKYLQINSTAAEGTVSTYWNNTAPTSSVFSVGTAGATNSSGDTFVAYLFATCTGVSKVGSYTGTGALQTVNCGFTSGARFVLIKRTDSTGDWYVYDSSRGLTSGNDPYFLMNSFAAQVTGTNYVDTDSTGFKVTAAAPAGLNASGGTYIFLAIA